MRVLAVCSSLWLILVNSGSAAVDIEGEWAVHLTTPAGHEFEGELTLEQDGSQLRGHWRAATPTAKKLKLSGEIDDHSIEFTVASAEKDLVRFSGTVDESENRMEGQCEVLETGGLLKWRAIRADEQDSP